MNFPESNWYIVIVIVKQVFTLRTKGENYERKRFSNFVFLCVSDWLFHDCSGQDIKIGGIMDTTGATSDVGKDYAVGMAEPGTLIKQGASTVKKSSTPGLITGTVSPRPSQSINSKRIGTVAIMGWGTGDTEALSPTVNKDKIPYVSASYSAHLTDPKDVDKDEKN